MQFLINTKHTNATAADARFRYDLVLMLVGARRVLNLHGQADSC
jgi:hypothetical protein